MIVGSAFGGPVSLHHSLGQIDVGQLESAAMCEAQVSVREEDALMRGESAGPVELNISPEKVFYIIVKAREFDAKVDPAGLDIGSNPADDAEREVLEDYPDDTETEELQAAIDQLTEDEVIDLIALAWVGRGDFDRSGWFEARALAGERHGKRSSDYLMGMPGLGDYPEEGLSELGYNLESYGVGRL